jgi:hypothetical protein
MILESAILDVKPGQESAFEAALKEARPLIAATPGFIAIAVRRCIDTPRRYLLLVEGRGSRTIRSASDNRRATRSGGRCCITSTTRFRWSSTSRRTPWLNSAQPRSHLRAINY